VTRGEPKASGRTAEAVEAMRAPGISDLAPQREPRTFGKIVPMPDESRSKDVEEPTKPGRPCVVEARVAVRPAV